MLKCKIITNVSPDVTHLVREALTAKIPNASATPHSAMSTGSVKEDQLRHHHRSATAVEFALGARLANRKLEIGTVFARMD